MSEGRYLVNPIDTNRFMLIDPVNNEPLLRRQLPFAPDPGTQPKEFLSLTYQEHDTPPSDSDLVLLLKKN